MKKIINNAYSRTYLVLLLGLFVIEIIFRGISDLSIISYSTLRIFIFLNIVSGLFAYLLNFTKPLFRKIFTVVLILGAAIYATAQMGFNNFLGVYASFQTSSQLGAVVDYIKDFIRSFKWYFFTPLIVPVIVTLYYIFIENKRLGKVSKLALKDASIGAFSSIAVCSLLFYMGVNITAFQSKFQTISNSVLFQTASNPSVAVEEYGTTGFLFLDVKAIIHPVEIESDYGIADSSSDDEEKEETSYTRTIDDEAWEDVIGETTNSTYSSLNNYFINRSITDKNDYTGLFEGKNLIVIMMESVDDMFINEELYPNFYRLLSGGWYWENNYSPRNSCATMNNEFSGMTSLFSIYNTCTANQYSSNTYYESIFNEFNDKDYTTFSAHDYTEAYYKRSTIHKNMGSGTYYGVEDLGIEWSDEYINWASDEDFLTVMLDKIDEQTNNETENFMTWFTTVSSHQPYGVDSIQGNMYYDLTEGTGYSSDVRRYMSKLKILDNALGILLEGLEERGILEDTVIVLYGDHYPYGISTSHINEVLDYDTSVDLNAEKVPLVIYNEGTTDGTVFSEYTSYINLLPTLANLFNLDYDPRLYLGTDMFSEDFKSLTVFADGSWKNEYAYYDAGSSSIKYYTDFKYTEEEIKAINDDIAVKMQVSNDAIKSNYFGYLGTELAKKRDELLQTHICENALKENYKLTS